MHLALEMGSSGLMTSNALERRIRLISVRIGPGAETTVISIVRLVLFADSV